MENLRQRLTVAGTVGGLLLATAAVAQDTGSRTIEEITVTAERRAASLQSTPVAVSAFSADSLEKLQVNQTIDLAFNVPSLVMYTGVANPSMVNLYLRGAGEQIGGLVTSESAVGIYIDDVYYARLGAANIDLVDVERIEVLRGPQGTLYGRNSMTGALKIITRTPDGEPWANLSVGYGRFNETLVNGSVGFPVGENWAASFTGQYRNRADGWFYDRATDERRGEREVMTARAKLAWIGSENFSAVLTGTWSDDDNDGLTPVATNSNTLANLTGGFRTTQSPKQPDGFNKQKGMVLDLGWSLGDLELRSISAYHDVSDLFSFDLSGGVEVAPGEFVTLIDRRSLYDTEQFSQELQLLGDAFDTRLRWIVGAYYFDEDALQTITDVIFFVPILPQVIDQSTRSYALFSQGSWDFTERLSGTLGLRYTRDRKSLRGQIDTFFGSGIPFEVDRSDTWSVWTPKIGLDFQMRDDLLLFSSISRGFRAGGYNGLTVAQPTVFNTPFDPESVWAYEFGAKSEWLDGRLRLNLAVFLNRIRDVQQSSTLGGGATLIQNVGDVDVWGTELEWTFLPTERLELFGHLTFQGENYRNLDPESIAAQRGVGRLSHLPETDAKIGLNYEWPLGAAGFLTYGADWGYKGSYYSDAANQPINLTDSTQLVNTFLAWSDSSRQWRASLALRNAFDEKYYRIGLVLAVPNGIRFANEPRTWMATLKYTF